MALVNEMSPVIALPEFDLFNSVPVQTSIENTRIKEIRPISLLNTGGHIEFHIQNSLNEYIRFDDTTLYTKLRVILSKKDNSPIVYSDWDNISIVNNFLNSLWSQVDLSIGETQTTLSLQTYHYRSYFELLLGSSKTARETFLKSSGYFQDDMTDPHKVASNRQELFKYIRPSGATTDVNVEKGKIFELEGKLHLDLLFQPKAILGGTKLKIKLVPNKPEFYFMIQDANLTAKIEFSDIILNAVTSTVNNDIVAAHTAALNVSPARYPLTRTEVRSFVIDKGVIKRNLENVINGQLPRRIFLAFVDNDSYSGNLRKNPYYFSHNNVRSYACFDGGKQFPMRAYTPDFSNNLYLREYMEFIKIIRQFNNDVRCGIDYNSYKTGYTILAIDLSADNSDGYYSSGFVNQPKNGVLRIELEFANATTETINALIYCEFDNQISILEERNAITDYH
jgi:hypothetical protein